MQSGYHPSLYKALIVSTFICIFILALPGSGSIATAQSTLTPTPTIMQTLPSSIPSNLPVITAANVHQLKPIAVLSPGEIYGAAWSQDGKMLAVYGGKGVWLYTLND